VDVHVTHVHIHNAHPEPQGGGLIFSPAEVRQWVARARSFRPTIPTSVHDYVVGAYVRMRQQQKRDEGTKKTFTHTSTRTLLGVLRLSQALARLRFANEVITDDVDEALRLVEVSKASLYEDDRGRRGDMSVSSRIFNLIRGMKESGAAATEEGSAGELDLRRVRERVLAKGFTIQQLEGCLDEYAGLDVSFLYALGCGSWTGMLICACRSGRRRVRVRGWFSLRRETMRMRMVWMDFRSGDYWTADWIMCGVRGQCCKLTSCLVDRLIPSMESGGRLEKRCTRFICKPRFQPSRTCVAGKHERHDLPAQKPRDSITMGSSQVTMEEGGDSAPINGYTARSHESDASIL